MEQMGPQHLTSTRATSISARAELRHLHELDDRPEARRLLRETADSARQHGPARVHAIARFHLALSLNADGHRDEAAR